MKTQVKKLVKSALFGITVLGGAMMMQSFGEAVKEEKLSQLTDVYVNSSSSGDYEKLSSPSSYNPANCQELSEENCAWTRTNTPGNVPDTFDASTAETLHQAGLIEPMDNNQGIYVDE